MKGASSCQTWLHSQWQRNGAWSLFMRPLSWLYGLISSRRRARYLQDHHLAYRCHVPVVVVGNLYVGGTGKTPIIGELAKRLQALGWQPGLVSRGYGRRQTQQPVIGQGQLDWTVFGDEPALIARQSQMPVCVHADRGFAAKTLLHNFPQVNVILSDDGLQHYRLDRDIELLVEDERGVGNGQLLPAGPLREPVSRRNTVDAILKRDAPLCRSDDERTLSDTSGTLPPTWPFSVDIDIFWCPATDQLLSTQAFISLAAKQAPVLALAGIGVPQRFFDGLRELGVQLDQTVALADHAALEANWLETFDAINAKTILMTEKDAVKCSGLKDPRIWVAKASVQWHQAGFFEWLSKKLFLATETLQNQDKAHTD